MISFEMNYEFSPVSVSLARLFLWQFGEARQLLGPVNDFYILGTQLRCKSYRPIGNDWINYFAICFPFSSPSRRCRFDGMCQNLNEIYEACVKAIIRNIIFMLCRRYVAHQ
jgi:hypothetical protein